MKKDFCKVIAWNNIPIGILIEVYCNKFSRDLTSKRMLETWAESHEQSCRYFIKSEFNSIYYDSELVNKPYFEDYCIICPYISFDFQDMNIELSINKELIEKYDGYNKYWSFWTSFNEKGREEYTVEISAEYNAENGYSIDIKGEVYVFIYRDDEDKPFMEFKTNVLNID